MAVVNRHIAEDVLRQMAQSQLQEYARQQMATLGPHGGMGLGGPIGQANHLNYYEGPLTALSNQIAQAYSTTESVPREPVKVEYPERGVHDHLQRRVNKWLKGVDLPLH